MKRKRVCRKQVSMEQEQGGREGECAKRVTHYSSDHQILLVGEGDFSFSLSLAHSFGSAANIVASSLDSYDDLNKKYKQAKSNLDELQKLGACLLHGVDASKMKSHSYLKMRRFDRVIFNFPHAGFHGKEDDLAVIKMHKALVLGFFKNASRMLTANGEIHVNHKTNAPFDKWDIEELAMGSILTLIERADFHKEDYPGYNNKRGDSYRCDEPFPLGKCSTFKFIHNPRAVRKAKSPATTTTVDLNCYPQPNHPSKLNETVASLFGLPNGYTPNPICHLLNNVEHRRDAPCAGYSSTHDMNPSSQRLSQPMQPLKPMESLNSFQPWPTSTNVRYSQINHIRTMDAVPLSHGTRNLGYQISRATSNYSQEAGSGTSQSAHGGTRLRSYDRAMPEFESHISQLHLGAAVHSELPRMMEDRRTFVAQNNIFPNMSQISRGTSNYSQEAGSGTSQSAHGGTRLRSYDRAMPEFESHISQLHLGAAVHSELPRMMEDRRTFVALPHHQPSTHRHPEKAKTKSTDTKLFFLFLFLLLFLFRVFPPLLVSSLSS